MKLLNKIIIGILLISSITVAQTRRSIQAIRIHAPVKIDGSLNESLWLQLPVMNNFVQFNPDNGTPATERSDVKVCYDDNAIYIGAILYDDSPDSILTELSARDDTHNANVEQFTLHISPFDDGNNSFLFRVSAANAQEDRQISAEGSDRNWDAVWESSVKVNSNGWSVEIKIPYSALRFPPRDIQHWGFNCHRLIKRKEEISVWSPVNNERSNWWIDMGRLENLKDLNPPLRLSFTPYLSTYAEKQKDADWESLFRGGLDVKYGITDGFTLDMTLIPDFGEVQSDDQILNLSPFETYYAERRPFFTESMDLFNKGNLFYTRRIGARPIGYSSIYDQLNPNELVIENPSETRMINASKISGRTSGGLGIGIFNAMTSKTEATVKTTINGDTRKLETQPFTNYNITVIDKTLKNNGYISVINSNVSMKARTANVTATTFRFATNNNSYAVNGTFAYSNINSANNIKSGHAMDFSAGKVSGKWQYRYSIDMMNDTYDNNDLGYMYHNDFLNHKALLNYNIYKPFGPFLNWFNGLDISHSRSYNSNRFIDTRISYQFNTMTKKQWRINMHAAWAPVAPHDYYESRIGKKMIMTKFIHNCGGFTTDRRKPFYVSVHARIDKHYNTEHNRLSWGINVEPYFRFSDRFTLGLDINYNRNNDDIGYVYSNAESGDIIMGRRDVTTQSTTLLANFRFSSKSHCLVRLRHYHSRADHNAYFRLEDNGYLLRSDHSIDHNINFNSFNVHAKWTWNFAPGSELIFAWKREVFTQGIVPETDYYRNFRNILDIPAINSISLKMLYYLDWHTLLK
ncbi:carbohydrate binding family 9 domain-containing protein [bacterium]|nr:carbohydrate binding family 9 domain-containing protein [bacterium]